jgi:hypothetical protein
MQSHGKLPHKKKCVYILRIFMRSDFFAFFLIHSNYFIWYSSPTEQQSNVIFYKFFHSLIRRDQKILFESNCTNETCQEKNGVTSFLPGRSQIAATTPYYIQKNILSLLALVYFKKILFVGLCSILKILLTWEQSKVKKYCGFDENW